MPDPAHPLKGKTIMVGVAGGIAAYKAVELVRLLVRAGAEVQVLMTEGARHFVGPLTFQALTNRPVFTDLFDLTQESEIGHIQIADRADLLIVAPATADVIARMAAGMADDVLTAVALATRAPVLLAPSMNVNMWQSAITQANVARLVELRGVALVGPGSGFLACHWQGPGRLAEPPAIAEAAAHLLSEQDLAGLCVAISAGPTHEVIDPVRFIGNRSSGKMGYALARAASRRGARVRLVSGPVELEAPRGVELTSVTDARGMMGAMTTAARGADIVIMAAAVADFRPRRVAEHKLKKAELMSDGSATIVLEPNPDILASLGAARRAAGAARPVLVGFAAETRDVVEHARQKLAQKGCDLVVANDVTEPDAGFSVDTNRVVLVSADRDELLELASKDEIAHRILDRVRALVYSRPAA